MRHRQGKFHRNTAQTQRPNTSKRNSVPCPGHGLSCRRLRGTTPLGTASCSVSSTAPAKRLDETCMDGTQLRGSQSRKLAAPTGCATGPVGPRGLGGTSRKRPRPPCCPGGSGRRAGPSPPHALLLPSLPARAWGAAASPAPAGPALPPRHHASGSRATGGGNATDRKSRLRGRAPGARHAGTCPRLPLGLCCHRVVTLGIARVRKLPGWAAWGPVGSG